jgi:urease accessory protein
MGRGIARVDLPLLGRFYSAWESHNVAQIQQWSHILIAYRETAELRAEDKHTGQALARLLASLGIEEMRAWESCVETTLVNIFAFASVHWQIPLREAMLGYLWSWLENQVLCAIKLVPLGQVAGQTLLSELIHTIPTLVSAALEMTDDTLGSSTLGIAMMSSRHETQYSRLFRS